MAKITYDNKVALNPQPSIADINKVTDADMNEIKTSVNDNCSYSTNEICIGEWIDGKPLYRKVYKVTNSDASYGVTSPSNVNTYTKLRVIQLDGDGACIPDYYFNSTDFLRIFKNNNGIQIRTSKTSNTFTHWIIVEYTKTTD